MELPDGEPDFGPWRDVPAADLAALLGRPRVLAVDGRSGSGKTTLVRRLVEAVPGAAVVHTDDVAWHHDFFDWVDLLADGVLAPWRSGVDVAFVPPGWTARGRTGAIEVPAAASMLVVEGVGAARRALAPLLDATVWVQTDRSVGLYRALARDGAEHRAFWDEWEARERPFLAEDRPWERASLVVSGDRTGELVSVGRGTIFR